MIGEGGDEPFAGASGHDWREWFQIRRVIKTFKPDVIHFHTNPLFMELYVKLFFRGSVVCSIHTPSVSKRPQFSRRLVNWAAEPCYWLPVSDDNWRRFKSCYPKAKGEVFYNPIRINEFERIVGVGQQNESSFIVGMVGRNADQKDWPSFHKVEKLVKDKVSGFQGFMAEKFNVVMGEMAPFCRTAEALKWARSHGLIGRMEDLETGGKGDCLSVEGGEVSTVSEVGYCRIAGDEIRDLTFPPRLAAQCCAESLHFHSPPRGAAETKIFFVPFVTDGPGNMYFSF